MSSEGQVRWEKRGHIALITLDRPERRNALNREMLRCIEVVTAEILAAKPRAVVLTGAGGAFCAGQDINPDNPQISALSEAIQTNNREVAFTFLFEIRKILDAFVALPMPIIAAVNGVAFGGGSEIATRCDLRVADPAATFCFSEVRLGLMPDWGGGVALTRLLGPSKAADLILTARKVSGAEALQLGLVNRVSQPGQVVEEALQLAEQISQNGPRAVRRALEVIRKTSSLSQEEALSLELESAASLIASGECVHGIGAFMSRATPEFPNE
jgi:enoyl-CoA hydratase/carnithine racemase